MNYKCKVYLANEKLDEVLARLERIEKLLKKTKSKANEHKPPGPSYFERYWGSEGNVE